MASPRSWSPSFHNSFGLEGELECSWACPTGHQGSSPNHTHHQLCAFSQSQAGLQLQPVRRRLCPGPTQAAREGGHCVTSWMSGVTFQGEETGPRPEPCCADCGPVENGPCICSVARSSLVWDQGSWEVSWCCFCFFGESASFRRSAKYDCGSPAEAAVGSSRVLPGPRGSPQDGGAQPAQFSASMYQPTPPCSPLPSLCPEVDVRLMCLVQLLPLPASW